MTKEGIIIIDKRELSDKIEETLELEGYEIESTDSPETAVQLINENPKYWTAIIFTFFSNEIAQLSQAIRGEPETEDMGIIAVVENPWKHELDEIYGISIDDYVTDESLPELKSKLQVINKGLPWPDVKKEVGNIILAEPDQRKRVFYGRLLRRKGFDLYFAVDRTDIEGYLQEDPLVDLIISPAELAGDKAVDIIKEIKRADDKDLPWIIIGHKEELSKIFNRAKKLKHVTLYNCLSSPENIIFIVNEILCPPPKNKRGSPRILFKGPVLFVHTRERRRKWGYLYNINETGAFIRTLSPSSPGSELELTFRPPFGKGRVQLKARCIWIKEYGQLEGPVIPHGMGVVYTQQPVADRAALKAGYTALVNALPSDPDFICTSFAD